MSQQDDPGNKSGVSRRTWFVWLAVFAGIILLMLFRDRWESSEELISQHRFEELVDSGEIVHAAVNYDPQNPALNDVIGKYSRTENGAQSEVPFRARIRLTGNLEEKLLSLPQVEPRQPNTMLLSVVSSVLPIVVIAALIWFFFIRQIRRVAKSSPSTPDLHARANQQQDRLDRILDKWEEQGRRMDSVVDQMERNNGIKR
jgi:ATP-dependent Zn protease